MEELGVAAEQRGQVDDGIEVVEDRLDIMGDHGGLVELAAGQDDLERAQLVAQLEQGG